jgi:phage I-like protein
MHIVTLAEEKAAEGTSTVQFLRTGTFYDMFGREVTITDAMLDNFARNFTDGAAGQDVPIDIGHQFAEAAGWVKDVRNAGELAVADVEWNELGKNLISGKVYKYLSAAVDVSACILRAISLVNFPAVKGLKPVALGENSATLCFSDTALAAFTAEDVESDVSAEVVEDRPASDETTEAQDVASESPLIPLSNSKEPEMADTQSAAVVIDDNGKLAELKVKLDKDVRDQVEGIYAAALADRERIVAETLEAARVSRMLSDFSTRVTTTARFALPIKPGDLNELLQATPVAQRKGWMDLMDRIATTGVLTLSEMGTEREGAPKTLSADTKKALNRWLAGGNKIETFFKANDLGDPKEYVL